MSNQLQSVYENSEIPKKSSLKSGKTARYSIMNSRGSA